MAPLTCSRCGEGVRWGWRHGRQAWWHRLDPDHHVRLGNPGPPVPWNQTDDSRPAAEPIPNVEVWATELDVTDDRVPGGARQVAKLADKHGWRFRLTYSRGRATHASQGTLLAVKDYVLLRAQLDSHDLMAVGSWEEGSFAYGYACRIRGNMTAPLKVNSIDLKAFIRREETA